MPSPAPDTTNSRAVVHKMLLPGGLLFRAVERLNATFSAVGDHAFFDPEQFPWIRDLESATAAMQSELQQVLDRDHLPSPQDILPGLLAISQDDRWKTYFLIADGTCVERNCTQCPRTAEALESVPELRTAFFSVLAPHKHIPPHRGPYNGVLRCHLGLRIPGGGAQCGIRVADETRYWREGRTLIFDDSYDHEAWNATSDLRVVLFIDFVRPVRWPARLLNAWMMRRMSASSVIRAGQRNLREWNRRADTKIFSDFLYQSRPAPRTPAPDREDPPSSDRTRASRVQHPSSIAPVSPAG